MKKILKKIFFIYFSLAVGLISCKKGLICDSIHALLQTEQLKPRYSSLEEFKKGITEVIRLIESNHIYAYLDTLDNGYPNPEGRKVPLEQFGYSILEKLGGDQKQVESAVYDVFHFDGRTNSLISYIMKAQMVNDISGQIMISIIGAIPLPPFAVDNFNPPIDPVATDTPVVNCCDNCNPSIKIRVTWTYKPSCGNYVDTTSGYAANNTLTHMSSGKIYRFDAEVTGCNCPGGVWSYKIDEPPGASFGSSSSSGKTVNLFPQSPGTYKITFTYSNCNKTVTKTFTLSVE